MTHGKITSFPTHSLPDTYMEDYKKGIRDHSAWSSHSNTMSDKTDTGPHPARAKGSGPCSTHQEDQSATNRWSTPGRYAQGHRCRSLHLKIKVLYGVACLLLQMLYFKCFASFLDCTSTFIWILECFQYFKGHYLTCLLLWVFLLHLWIVSDTSYKCYRGCKDMSRPLQFLFCVDTIALHQNYCVIKGF